jgi:hypothetical protein
MRWPDPWSGYLATVSHPARLTSRELRPDGQLHPSNLDHQRILAINGEKDRIISSKVMRKYIELFQTKTLVDLEYREHAGVGHELQLTEEEIGLFLERMLGDRRDPLPDSLSWTTERTDRYARRSWLVISELAAGQAVDESNILPRHFGPNVPRTRPYDPLPWGCVRLEREGNEVRAETAGVRRFRLLLSPERFDLAKPVRVLVDGALVHEAEVRASVEVLLRWAAEDDDRTRLFAAELEVVVPE